MSFIACCAIVVVALCVDGAVAVSVCLPGTLTSATGVITDDSSSSGM